MNRRFLDAVSRANPLLSLSAAGFSNEDTKKLIIATLDPFVSDKAGLEKFALSNLGGEAVSVGKLSTRPQWEAMLQNLVRFRREMWRKDPKAVLAAIAKHAESVDGCCRRFGSMVLLEVPKADLPLEDFAFECFRNIGAVGESSLFPHLTELLEIALLGREQLDGGDNFGDVVRKIERLYPDRNLIAVPPWNLTVSQWRNVAEHHTYEVASDRIVVTSGRAKRVRIELQRDELFAIAQELMARLAVLKSARALCIFDNRTAVISRLPSSILDRRDERTDVLQFATAISTQGFRLDDAEITASSAVFTIVDISGAPDARRRAVHCSQFLANCALSFENREISIIFSPRSGTAPELRFSITREQAVELCKEADPLSKLASVFRVERLPIE